MNFSQNICLYIVQGGFVSESSWIRKRSLGQKKTKKHVNALETTFLVNRFKTCLNICFNKI